MSEGPSLYADFLGVGTLIGTIATAVATLFLWRVTKLLATETTRMAEASSQPHVVATIIPNTWSMMHFDLHVQNTGNATAYDIRIQFDPPLTNADQRGKDLGVPFQEVSILKPSQNLSSYLANYQEIKGERYAVEISWRKAGSNTVREINRYILDMRDHQGVSRLGQEPLVQIAKHVQKLDENWARVLKGHHRIRVDAFTLADRLRERRDINRRMRQAELPRSGPACGDVTDTTGPSQLDDGPSEATDT